MFRRAPNRTLYGYCYCWCQTPVVPSLSGACCDVLVQDARYLGRLLPSVPDCFIPPLLARAVDAGRDRAAQLLVSFWPYGSLDLQTVLGTDCPLAHHWERLPAVKSIVRAFVQMALSGEDAARPARLRRLDVTGFQCGRQLIEFIVDKVTAFSKTRPVDRGCRILRCDFLVDEAYTLKLFCAMLRCDKRALRIDVANLEVESVGKLKLTELLSAREAEQFVGLSMAYNSLQSEGLRHLCERLRHLRDLVTLDVSSNGIHRADDCFFESLAATIRALPRLRRLSLKSCHIGGYLNVLLSSCYRQLEHLDVSDCRLFQQDFHALERLEKLESLALSDNILSNLIPELATALLVLGRLRVVLLSNCGLMSESFNVVWDALKASGDQLCRLDLSYNKLSEDKLTDMVADLEAGSCLPLLTHLLLPKPTNPSPRYFQAVKRIQVANPNGFV